MKSVIIYTYFSSPSSDYNLNFFVKKELSYKDNIDYIIVINGYVCNKNIQFPNLENLTILKRENNGYDFGGSPSFPAKTVVSVRFGGPRFVIMCTNRTKISSTAPYPPKKLFPFLNESNVVVVFLA